MRGRWLPTAALLLVVALPRSAAATAPDRPAGEEIGAWVLSCPAGSRTEACRLRHRTAIAVTAGGPGAGLEVLHRGGAFVPAVAVHGLSAQAALAAMLALPAAVALRFDAARPAVLECSLGDGAIVCAPAQADAERTAIELATARTVEVRLRMGASGRPGLVEPTRSLDLQRTAEALARFRATAPASESVPTVAGLDWRGLLDRLAQDAGFTGGLADLFTAATHGRTR